LPLESVFVPNIVPEPASSPVLSDASNVTPTDAPSRFGDRRLTRRLVQLYLGLALYGFSMAMMIGKMAPELESVYLMANQEFLYISASRIREVSRLGYDVAIITGRSGMALRHRADELAVPYVFQGVKDKAECFVNLLERLGLHADEAAMLGDDLPDLSLLKKCGYPMAVADAVSEIREIAAFTTPSPGGSGAVREAIEHLIKARNQWNKAIARFEERGGSRQ
jgi:3-deoxy-D-manno-octulosonate 8-phosphate phosphatase (KDO 8-P phosphatase)